MSVNFFVVLAWRTPQLDLQTPALYQMHSFNCHGPLTKCLINLGKGVRRIEPGAAGYFCDMSHPQVNLKTGQGKLQKGVNLKTGPKLN